MRAITHSRFRGALLTGVSLTAVVAGMSWMDPRVHTQVNRVTRGEGLSPEVAAVVHQGQQIAVTAFDALRDQGMAHSELAIFALAAAVLLFFMFRT